MSIYFASMTLILLKSKFEAIPSKDAGEVAFQVEADTSRQILGFCHNSFSYVARMVLILKFLNSQSFQKCILLPPLMYGSQVKVKCMKMC